MKGNIILIRFFSIILAIIIVLSMATPCLADSESKVTEAPLAEDWRSILEEENLQNLPTEISKLQDSANSGSTEAMLRLGYLCAYGYGNLIDDNYIEGTDANLALEWFNKVAEAGEPETAADKMIDVGYSYLLGTDKWIPEDTASSLIFFERAEQLGVFSANNVLGIYYTYGAIVERDPYRALELFVEGARSGYIECALAIEEYAYAYYIGSDEDIDINFETAFMYYEALTEFNNTRAMYNLGLLYIFGLGVPKDHDKGIEWISKAADMGDEVAVAMLDLV